MTASPAFKLNSAQLIAFAIILVIGAWIGSGLLHTDNAETTTISLTETNNPVPSVRVEELHAEPRKRILTFYGTTEALRKVNILAETEGKVAAILAQEGKRIAEGDPIVQLEIRDRAAALESAKALLSQRMTEYNTAQSLFKESLQSKRALQETKAKLQQAKEAVTQAELEVSRTTIKSPFEGNLEAVHVDIGELVRIGTAEHPVATVMTLDPLLVVVDVAEAQIPSLFIGQRGEAIIAGNSYPGTITYVSKVAEPTTRTFRVEMEIANDNYALNEGLTAEMRIPAAEQMAHHLSSSLLTLSDSGDIGVKLVDEQQKVSFHPIKVLDEDSNGIWVTGLPETIRMITVGQAFVREGDTVSIQQAPPSSDDASTP